MIVINVFIVEIILIFLYNLRMNLINTVTNFVYFVSTPLWKCCRQKKVSEAALSALPVRGGGTTEANTSWKTLSEGGGFSYRGVKFRVCTTVGDGACALHALLGKKLPTGTYFYPGGGAQARKDYLNALQLLSRLKTFEGFLADRLYEIITPGTMLTSETQALKNRINQIDKAGWFSFFKSTTLETLAKQIDRLQKTVTRTNPIGPQITKLLSQAAQLPNVKQAYYDVCVNHGHYFSTQEVGIAAELFDKEVTIFVDQLSMPQVFNQGGRDKVAIYLRPNHFSRLEIES
jgi:hypothetical protein